MIDILALLKGVAVSLPWILINPFFWLAVGLIVLQVRKQMEQKERIYGIGAVSVRVWVISILEQGFVGGLVGSLLFIFVGVSLDSAGLQYVWPVSLALMLIDRRFICFSYAGGLLSLSALLFGSPIISVPQLTALVGILHLVEALLIRFGGAASSIPLFLRNSHGRAYGSYILQRLWPVPLVILTVVPQSFFGAQSGYIDMPGWWPLIKSGFINGGVNVAFSMFPVVAVLGYGDIAIKHLPDEKVKFTSRLLSIYSLILISISIAGSHIILMQYAAALFSILGHELIIWIGRLIEANGEPRLSNPLKGIRVMSTMPDSIAENIGIKTGDIIRAVNGLSVNTEAEIKEGISRAPFYLEVEVERECGGIAERHILKKRQHGMVFDLGIVTVPKDYGEPQRLPLSQGLITRIWKSINKSV